MLKLGNEKKYQKIASQVYDGRAFITNKASKNINCSI